MNFELIIVGVAQNVLRSLLRADSPNRGVFSDAKIIRFKVVVYCHWKLLGLDTPMGREGEREREGGGGG